ncbi:hypothetical protein E4L95_10890 [Paracoccus liaowanqingii]|uniref:WGxxGxxG-CTERM domain-containing protein n=1 Tax=Paracoccus liaowanqingii TaxID=2560053 RepID=A0A4Z1C9B9_9RHOB|nr:hypothetical protein E4L95_10890 [Paracoccus liaowanqingii]
MSKGLRICTVALALAASSPVLAQVTTTEPANAPPVGVEQDDGFDWGLLGLLGLLGLAGLKGRQRDDVPTTTTKRL